MRAPRTRLWSLMFAIAVLAVGLAGFACVAKRDKNVVKVVVLTPAWLVAAIYAVYWVFDEESGRSSS